MKPLRIIYQFGAEKQAPVSFVVELDPATLALTLPANSGLPEWTRLAHDICPDCPLATTATSHCPMATALVELLEFSRQIDSFAPLNVAVTTPEREIRTTAPAQRAIAALMGLLIATCACPDVAWLRPMARFHLPLASEEETIYRATSMYLLAQFFRQKHGASPDLSLAGLRTRYERLHEINMAMAARLRQAIEKDASVNAVILLDLFAKAMPYSVDESVAELEYLFSAYLAPDR